MFDSLYPEQAGQALAERARRPELNAPRWSGGAFTGFMDAFAAAVPAAALESARSLSPLLDAFGKTMAYRNGARREDSIDKIGENEFGPLLRDEIARIAPDPHTTGAAAQVVYGVGKLVGKAAGYSMLAGPYGGAVLTGADEGVNETMRLQDKGVDTATATKAGAVHGVVMAANVALHLAGKTIAQTTGLALAGGPVSFMGENAAIASILDQADYAQVAREYDPFEPVGLTVSTVAPLLFGYGAHALRAHQAKASPPPLRPDLEAAARTLQTARNVDAVSLAPIDDFAARSAHADALTAAARSLDAGQPVNLPLDALPIDPDKATAALAKLRDAADAIEARAPHHAGWAEAEATFRDATAPAKGDTFSETAHARQIAAENPDMPIYSGATDENGQAVKVRAADLLDEVNADYQQASHESSRVFAAAINCFLRHPA